MDKDICEPKPDKFLKYINHKKNTCPIERGVLFKNGFISQEYKEYKEEMNARMEIITDILNGIENLVHTAIYYAGTYGVYILTAWYLEKFYGADHQPEINNPQPTGVVAGADPLDDL